MRGGVNLYLSVKIRNFFVKCCVIRAFPFYHVREKFENCILFHFIISCKVLKSCLMLQAIPSLLHNISLFYIYIRYNSNNVLISNCYLCICIHVVSFWKINSVELPWNNYLDFYEFNCNNFIIINIMIIWLGYILLPGI